jgi:myo-inositol-1(or 4)-monophosphatase
MSRADELAELLALATAVAEEAAELLRAARTGGVLVAATKSTELDIVTEADRAAEELIRSRLLSARPDDGMLGEEGSSIVGSSGVTWIVDPLDGTVNYLYGAGPYAVSIAAVEGPVDPSGWTALVGVVVVCTEGVSYAASRGGGASVNGMPIAVSSQTELGLALVSTGFGYDRIARRSELEVLGRVAPEVRDVRMGGSAATDLCLVASGRLDAYYERHLGPWDHAAGALIVREAGGVVEGADRGAPDAGLVLAGPPAIVQALRPLL